MDVLLVVTDGELQVTGNDTLLLVITSRVTRELEDLSSKVLEYCREVNCSARSVRKVLIGHKGKLTRCASTDTLGVVALLQETVNTTDGELETSLG